MSDCVEPGAERKVFNTYFEIKTPEDLRPETVVITMATPRESDIVEFVDPDKEDNPNPKGNLAFGKGIGARLRDQRSGDFIAINYQGVSKSHADGVSSILFAYTFSEDGGWKPAKGAIAFSVKK